MSNLYGIIKLPLENRGPADGYTVESCAAVRVFFEVAVTGVGGPFHPDAKLYLKVKADFSLMSSGYFETLSGDEYPEQEVHEYIYLTTVPYDFPNPEYPYNGVTDPTVNVSEAIMPRLVFKMASGEPSCALYGSERFTDGTDLVLEAKEWWPYCNSKGKPAWQHKTGPVAGSDPPVEADGGAMINGGPFV